METISDRQRQVPLAGRRPQFRWAARKVDPVTRGPSKGAHGRDARVASTVTSVEQLLDETFSGLVVGAADAVDDGAELTLTGSGADSVSVPITGQGSIQFDGPGVAVDLDADAAKGEVSGDMVIQPDSHDSTDTVIVPQSAGSVEVLYVLNDENAPSQFFATLDLPAGATLTTINDQVLVAADARGELLFAVTAPWAIDAAANAVGLRLDVQGGNEVVLTVLHKDAVDVVYPVLVDPYYDATWSNLKETVWCTVNLIAGACSRANASAGDALAYAEAYFPGTVHNGKGDAFRHCYWSARMTIEDGAGTAEKIATRHENTASGQPDIEKTMDLRNNSIGRAIGVGKGRNTEASVRSTCRSRAAAGSLWIIVNGKLQGAGGICVG